MGLERCDICDGVIHITNDGGRYCACGRHSASGPRGSVLIEAHKVINGERQNVYGSPEDSFALIAEYWRVYLKRVDPWLTARDVAIMMTLFKIARESNQHRRDNLVDAAGYIGIAADMAEDDEN
jgi:hypothetical protein